MTDLSRRDLLKKATLTAGAAITASIPALPQQASPAAKIKLVVVGGHPGDPEVCCGGTMALFAAHGHEVVTVYLNRGDAGIAGKSSDEAGRIRTAEALAANKVLGSRAAFLTQADGNSEINKARYEEMADFLRKESPGIVLAHWPIDSHRDHRNSAILAYDAWLAAGKSYDLYFYEVELGKETQLFSPTDFVDISSVREKKHQAANCHSSQGIEEVFKQSHDIMERLRGMESGYPFAEAFVRHTQNPNNALLSLIDTSLSPTNKK